MTYTKHTWGNGQNGNTPITAHKLNEIEDGIHKGVYHTVVGTSVPSDGTSSNELFIETNTTTIDGKITAIIKQKISNTYSNLFLWAKNIFMNDGESVEESINGKLNSVNVIDNLSDINANVTSGKAAGALAVSELNRNLDLTNSRRLWQRDYYLNAADINGTKDMLSVGTVDFYSGVSRNLFLNIQAADIAIWTGLPTTIAGFKIPWIGERLVMPRTSTGTAAAHIKLELREWYPVPGRVFTIFFNYGKWSAWNVVTPVKD